MQEFSRGHVFAQRYRVLDRLGKGGMGSVYEAEELATGDVVALKVLSSELVEDPRFVERFRREAEATARLAHPNIVRVEAFLHRASEPALIVMERLRGEPLLARVRRGPVETNKALSIAMQLTDALATAHRAGIVHRDLKPANVFLVPLAHGGLLVKLLDFGIAKLKESDGYSRLTQTGVLLGTPRYASPEQVRGDKTIDARSDVFSLGVLLYGMLAGRPPFPGRGAALLVAIERDEPRPLSSVSPALAQVVRTAMAKRREDRFATMEAFEAALRSVSNQGDATVANPIASPVANPTVPATPAGMRADDKLSVIPPAPAEATSGAVAATGAPATRELPLLAAAPRALPSVSTVPKTPVRGTPRHALPAVEPSRSRASAPHARVPRPSTPDATVHGLRGRRLVSVPRGLLVAGGLLVALAVVGLSFVGAGLWLRDGFGLSSSAPYYRVDGVEVWSPFGWSPNVDYLPSRAARDLGPACVEWEYQECACMSVTPSGFGSERCGAALGLLRRADSAGTGMDCAGLLRPRGECTETAVSTANLGPGSPQWVAWAQLRAEQYGPSCSALLAQRCSCDPAAASCTELELDLHAAPGNDAARRRVLRACAEVDDDEAPPCP